MCARNGSEPPGLQRGTFGSLMAPLNLDRLSPDRDGSLERYAAQIQELILWLRDEGHILSSIDQHFVELWWEAGYPLETVLGTLRTRGERLKERKNPPRGLPLRSLKRWVEKEGERARQAGVGAHEESEREAEVFFATHRTAGQRPESPAERGPLNQLINDVQDRLALRQPDDPVLPLREALTDLEALRRKALPEGELFSELLALGRRYYDRALEMLPSGERVEREERISASLGSAARQMEPSALDATVSELMRREVRSDDPLFDPSRYWNT